MRAYREMTIPAGPEWVEEHIRRLSAAGIQTHFQFANITQLETVERMMRRGDCNVPLILTWVAIGGGFDQPNIYNLANFVRAVPDGAVLTLETSMLNVLPINMMAIALGLHVRCGIEDNIWTQDRKSKMSTVQQIEQLVRISREFGREVATGKEARRIYKIGVFYDTSRRRWPPTALRRTASPEAQLLAEGGLTMAARDHPDRSRLARPCRRALADVAGRAPERPSGTVRPWGATTSIVRASGAIEREATAIDGPVILVAHSGGVIMVAHWAADEAPGAGCAARTPPDFEQPMPEATRRWKHLPQAAGCRFPQAAAVPQHRRGQPQRSASPDRPRHRAGARVGEPVGRSRQGRPPQPGLGLRRVAAGGRIHQRALHDQRVAARRLCSRLMHLQRELP